MLLGLLCSGAGAACQGERPAQRRLLGHAVNELAVSRGVRKKGMVAAGLQQTPAFIIPTVLPNVRLGTKDNVGNRSRRQRGSEIPHRCSFDALMEMMALLSAISAARRPGDPREPRLGLLPTSWRPILWQQLLLLLPRCLMLGPPGRDEACKLLRSDQSWVRRDPTRFASSLARRCEPVQMWIRKLRHEMPRACLDVRIHSLRHAML